MTQTLFGNPKGPVELGNPNTCAETKLSPNFVLSCSRSSPAMSLTVYTVDLTKARIGFVEDSSSQQTETTVSNKNKCITKITSDQTSIPRFAKLQSEINAIT